jgi:hypothetical protein
MDEADRQGIKAFIDEAIELSDWLCLASPMRNVDGHLAIMAMTYALWRGLSNLPDDEDAKVTAKFIRAMVRDALKIRKSR